MLMETNVNPAIRESIANGEKHGSACRLREADLTGLLLKQGLTVEVLGKETWIGCMVSREHKPPKIGTTNASPTGLTWKPILLP